MTAPTNSLVAKSKKMAIPATLAATLVLGGSFFFAHNQVHAASTVSPLDDNSVASLVSLDNAVENVAARVTPAVVNVSVVSRGNEEAGDGDSQQGSGNIPQGALPPGLEQFFGNQNPFGRGQQGQRMPQQQQVERGIGSGIIISPDGYIVTNNHVIDGAMEIRVTLNDRRVLKAKLVGADKLTDLAVIKVDAKNLPNIPWGDSGKLRPGQTVLAFGSPFGSLQFSVTRGIVSALNRPNPFRDDARKPGDFIQTDAAINPGNSGGPLVDARGEVIGINTFIITGGSGSFAGAGFAIPSQIAKATTDELIKNGVVHHGYLGIAMNDVTPENSSFFNLPDATGAIVSQVTPDSPASRAGLKSGDVLRDLNGKTIANGGSLQVAVSQVSPGTTIKLGILRDGKSESLDVKVGEFHAKGEVAENGDANDHQGGKLGLAMSDLTPDVRQQLNIPAQVKGAAVESVRPASPAEDAGLAPGDVILEVNRHPVQNADKFVSEVHSTPAGKDILLLVWSQGNATYRVVHTDGGSQNGM